MRLSANPRQSAARVLALIAPFLTWNCSSGQGRSSSDDFFQRRERSTFATINRQIEASGGRVDTTGPFVPDTRRIAGRLEALLPDGRIQDEGKYARRPLWSHVEIRSTGWEVEVQTFASVERAAREMAQYIASVQAAFQPGTMSGSSIGQSRFFWDCFAIVFLRQNVVVWVRMRDYPSRVYPPKLQLAKEYEGVAAKVDQELVALLSGN